jgi:transcriptional regulator with XRE-family HTH domain
MTGDELKKARDLLGLSQLSLAVLVQVSFRQIEEFEARKVSLAFRYREAASAGDPSRRG